MSLSMHDVMRNVHQIQYTLLMAVGSSIGAGAEAKEGAIFSSEKGISPDNYVSAAGILLIFSPLLSISLFTRWFAPLVPLPLPLTHPLPLPPRAPRHAHHKQQEGTSRFSDKGDPSHILPPPGLACWNAKGQSRAQKKGGGKRLPVVPVELMDGASPERGDGRGEGDKGVGDVEGGKRVAEMQGE